MNRFIIALPLILALCACGHRQTGTVNADGLTFDSIVVDTAVALDATGNAPKCTLSLHLQYAKGKNAEKINNALLHSGIIVPDYLLSTNKQADIKTAIDLFVNRLLADYVQDYGMLYRQDKEHASAYRYDYSVHTSTRYGADGVVVYTANVYTYAGGMYGIRQTLIKNIDIKTGKILRLEDVFVPGYEPTLKELLLEKIQKKFNVKSQDELEKKQVFADGYIYVTDNFALDDDKITFIYCEDEIAPHAIGEVAVEIERDEMKRILK